MDNINVLQPKPPKGGQAIKPDGADIQSAVDVGSGLPKTEQEAYAATQAKQLVAQKNASNLAWAKKSMPAHETAVSHTDKQIEAAQREVDKTDFNVQTHTSKMARNTQKVDGQDIEFSTKRAPSERRSRMTAAVFLPLGLAAETFFAATNMQSSGIYEHFDYIPGANLIPLFLAVTAMFLVYLIGQSKVSAYRHFDHDDDRRNYRAKVMRASRFWTPIWVILAALILATAISFADIGTRASYPDWINSYIKAWNLWSIMLQGPMPLFMMLFLAIQIWGMSTTTAAIILPEEHAYMKARYAPTRVNEAHIARQQTRCNMISLRQGHVENAAVCDAILQEIVGLEAIIKADILAGIQAVEVEVTLATAQAKANALAHRGSKPALTVVQSS